MKKTGYILGVSRGHNSGIALLKDGQLVFSIEEERLSRRKYDGSPFASMVKVLEYTNKVDYVVVVHTTALRGHNVAAGNVEYSGDDVYTGMARKLGLIDQFEGNIWNHPQVIDMSLRHHAAHASLAFYNSGFDKAAAVVVDGAGSAFPTESGDLLWEVESLLDCSYSNGLRTVYKHLGCRNPIPTQIASMNGEFFGEPNSQAVIAMTDRAGIVKAYEAVTQYCGFSAIEAGKTMGLFPYGQPNDNLPKLFSNSSKGIFCDRNAIVPTYPNSAIFNAEYFPGFEHSQTNGDVTLLQNRRDAAYWIQKESQEAVLNYILKAVEMTGHTNVVLSGGYGLNCVANYYYLTKLNELGINLYVEPMSNDGGTAIGAALLFYYETTKDANKYPKLDSLYLGPINKYTDEDFTALSNEFGAEVYSDVSYNDVIHLLRNKTIVTMYQGRSENGPRALGNRSVLFDPTFKDGKDYVNSVKRREYFRPFAASVLEEEAPAWFDMRGMSSSEFMMYAVNCQEGVADKVPCVIHEDGTCRIQTVNKDQNEHYYNLINTYFKQTGVPLLFNTSFNLGGEPLVETLEDAFRTLKNSDIEYCYFPEYGKMVYCKNGV